MGPAEPEPPDSVDPDADMLPCSAAPADPVSKVLDDDDLLIEIIVRLGFPNHLVRVALVCKRWYLHASDPAFLRRFCKLHPPRILGFYVNTMERLNPTCFVPMLPRPPELDAVFRHASFSLDAYKNGRTYVEHSWKNNVLFRYRDARGFVMQKHNPLFPERGMAVVIPPLPYPLSDGNRIWMGHVLTKEEGDNLSYFYVFEEITYGTRECMVYVYALQDGVWCMITSATTELHPVVLVHLKPLLIDNKIYILASPRAILVLDLRAFSFSTIQPPQGLGFCGRHFFPIEPLGLMFGARTMLSRADDGLGVYLIHINLLDHLIIWLHERDNWLLVDTICLREMCADLRFSDCSFENGDNGFVEITMLGPNAEFVLLETPRCVLHWDIKCRMLRKVHGDIGIERRSGRAHPIMMIWPPTFPALKDDLASGYQSSVVLW